MRTANRLGEFSYAWRIVLASALGIGLGLSPIPIYTLGVFAAPLAAEFEWRIDEVFAALPVLTLCALVLSPVAGLVIDRVGVRRVAIWSVLGFGVGLMAHALNPGSYWLYLATWAFVAILGIGTLPITWTRAINNWFHDCRGLALGFSLVATGFFGVFAKFYVASLIELVGWRLAFVGLGLLPILIALPAAIFFFRDANDSKVPDRVRPQSFATGAGGTPLNAAGLDASVVFQDWRFWLMCVCFVAISFGVGGTIPNLENLFSSKGFGRNDAVKLASLVGLSVVVGRLASGYLIDRVWAPAIAFCMLVPPALSCYLLMDQDLTYALAAVSVLLIGLAAGAEQDLMAFLVARYFGMKGYGVVYGLMYSSFALGAGAGPWVLGRIYESSGSYDTALGYLAIAFVAGALPLLLLGRYRNFDVDQNG